MKKGGWLLANLLCAAALFLLVPALITGPGEAGEAPGRVQALSAVFSGAYIAPVPPGEQPVPLRADRPEGLAEEAMGVLPPREVRADANGHPLGESTYTRAVYEAFRPEDKCG